MSLFPAERSFFNLITADIPIRRFIFYHRIALPFFYFQFFIFTISNITPDLSWAGYVSPYKFIDLDVVNPAYALDLVNIMYFTLFSFLLIFFSLRIYLRKDIYL